ncbi:DUF2306 domain-containing protein [Flavobacterium suzhouense]|uniref:DUF2306 domain-containing protein n=1 Tax=Flavobacterium suzhouense TaxID=1529638 RepID=A0ABW5NSB8_9FLAO
MNTNVIKAFPYLYSRRNLILTLLFLYFYWLMVKITLYYVPFSTTAAFLKIKQTEVTTLPEYIYIFYAHVYTSIFLLLFGFIQFFNFKSKAGKLIHRYSGYQYIILLLVFAAPSGIYMGFHANGDFWSKISFVILGTLWWISTFIALIRIKQHRFVAHRNWMMRSYALSLSAVTLRLWKVILVYCFELPPMNTYQIIAWLGWIPNLLIAELLIYNKSTQKS